MNIVLTSVHIRKSPDAIPLATALLKSAIMSSRLNTVTKVNCIECTIELRPEDFVDQILSSNPDIIGLSVYLWNRDYYERVITLLKERDNRLIILAGGAEMRANYQDFIDLGVDYTIQGEGEEVIVELLEAIKDGSDPNRIKGINDSSSRFIVDLSTLTSPLLTNNIDLKKYDGYLWELSRGCPFSCDFCFESRGSKGVRYYPMDRVEAELDYLIKSNIDQVFVLDPTFNKDLPRAKKILKLIKRKNRGIHFHFEVRAELLDDEIARLFAEIGASLQIGIQSGHDSVLKLINRRLNRELFAKKISLLNRYGVIFGLDLIYGLPSDNYEGFKASMEYVLSLQPNHLDIFPLAVLPGTQLWDNSENFQLMYSPQPPYIVESSPSFSSKDMLKATKLKDSCDFIYNRCKSTGWLLQVVKELKTNATDFIESYSNWSRRDKNEGIDQVKSYIKEYYKPKRFTLIEDIINYHQAYSKALLAPKGSTDVTEKDITKAYISFGNTVSLMTLRYPLLDAFDSGYYTIEEIKQYYPKESSRVVSWYHLGGEVVFETYSPEIMDFLSQIDGKIRVYEINSNIDIEFLLFAQSSGMLQFSF